MQKKIVINPYHNSAIKKISDLSISLFGIVLFSPAILTITLLVKLTSPGPVLFRQKRIGYKGKIFEMIKFRTMRLGAEMERRSLRHLNEADGPVFKITDDPRFTKVGKILANTGLDELPQFVNVLRNEMSIVGPRPLPLYEARKLTKSQKVRELVKPGITSSWVFKGSHQLKFSEWMRLDREYVENATPTEDLKILLYTASIVLKSILKKFS